MSDRMMKLTLQIWRQKGPLEAGRFERYECEAVSEHMSFLEMLDVLNERLAHEGQEPIAFDHDCREGICGACGVVINGVAHGPQAATTTCQLHMRHFRDGDEIVVEPWRAAAFPVVKDLIVDRSAFDRIIQAGGYVSVRAGSAARGQHHAGPQGGRGARHGRGGVHRLRRVRRRLPERVGEPVRRRQDRPPRRCCRKGQPERASRRVHAMVAQMDAEGFGHCTNHDECEAVCPSRSRWAFIARLNRDFLRAAATAPKMVPARKKPA